MSNQVVTSPGAEDRFSVQRGTGTSVPKALQNGSAPACLLPAEILSSIFMSLAQSSTPRKCIGITHVCQYWREVALGCANLWATVPFINRTFTNIALERSRNLPLSVRLGRGAGAPNFGSCGKILRQTFSGPRQVKSISIRPVFILNPTTRRRSFQAILSNFTDIAPLLDTLYVECLNTSRCLVPDDFLRGGTPSLRSLGLVNCDIRWANIPFASTLTHLHLSHEYPLRYEGRPSVRELVNALRGTPSLVELELRNYLPKPSNTSSADSLSVALRSLTQVTLEDDVDSVVIFTSVIRIPKATSVTLEFDWHLRSAADLRRILMTLDRTWRDDLWEYQPLQQAPSKLEIKGHEDEDIGATF